MKVLVALALAVALVIPAAGTHADPQYPVVIVPGAGNPQNTLAPHIAQAYRDAGYTVYQPAFENDTAFFGAASEELRAYIDGFGASKVHLVGLSAGGLTARYYLKFRGGTAKTASYVSWDTPQRGIWWNPWGEWQLNLGDDTPGSLPYMAIGRDANTHLDGGSCNKTLGGGMTHAAAFDSQQALAWALEGTAGACP